MPRTGSGDDTDLLHDRIGTGLLRADGDGCGAALRLLVRTVRGLLAVLAITLAGPVGAQGFEIDGTLFEPGSTTVNFPAPRVEIQVVSAIGGASVLGKFAERVRLNGDRYEFNERLGDLRLSNMWAVLSAESGEYVSPNLKYVQLDGGRTGAIEVTMPLQRRGVLAEAYRREVFDAFRQDNPGQDDYLRALSAAFNAIEFDPSLDNYLLAVKASRVAIHNGDLDHPSLVTSNDDLRGMKGFEALSFADQFRVQSELLDLLAAAPDPTRRLSSGETFQTAAIRLAEGMLAQLDESDPGLAALPATKVFNAANSQYSRQQDCSSLIRNSAHAIELSEALTMNWSSQRRFLLDWGDCLERLSGVGDGRSAEIFLEQTAAQPALRGLWTRYADAFVGRELNLLFPSNDQDARLKGLMTRAGAIKGVSTDGQ